MLLNNVSRASFAYDGDGARTSKTSGGATTSYVNDTRSLTQVRQETRSGNTISHVSGLSQYDPAGATEAARWSYFHADAQNVRLLTDGAVAVSLRRSYDPFGNVREEARSGDSDFGYGGEQRGGETGLVNLRSRLYDPVLGRFLTRDSFEGVVGVPQS